MKKSNLLASLQLLTNLKILLMYPLQRPKCGAYDTENTYSKPPVNLENHTGSRL
jgi:hypothetical protein